MVFIDKPEEPVVAIFARELLRATGVIGGRGPFPLIGDGISVAFEGVCVSVDGAEDWTRDSSGGLGERVRGGEDDKETEKISGGGFFLMELILGFSDEGEEEETWGLRGGKRRAERSACTDNWSVFDTVNTSCTLGCDMSQSTRGEQFETRLELGS